MPTRANLDSPIFPTRLEGRGAQYHHMRLNPVRFESDTEKDYGIPRIWQHNLRTQPHGEFKVRLDIPFFDVYLHIEDYLDWE